MYGSKRTSGRRFAGAAAFGIFAAALLLVGCGGGGGGGNGSGGTTGADPQAIYVVDQGNSRVAAFHNMLGLNRVNFGAVGTGAGQFTNPNAMAVDSTGKIYIADSGNNRLVRMDNSSGTNFTSLTAAGGTNFGAIGGVALDAFDKVYITDTANGRIVRMDDITGANPVSFDTTTVGVANPQNIALDASKRIYFTSGGVVHRINLLSGFNHLSFDTGLTSIGGIAVDSAGHIYVSDTTGNRVLRYDDMTGANVASLGSGTAGSGINQFSAPMGLAVDATDRLLIADTGNNRVVRVSSILGTGWTSYGTVGVGPGDFTTPVAVAVH